MKHLREDQTINRCGPRVLLSRTVWELTSNLVGTNKIHAGSEAEANYVDAGVCLWDIHVIAVIPWTLQRFRIEVIAQRQEKNTLGTIPNTG